MLGGSISHRITKALPVIIDKFSLDPMIALAPLRTTRDGRMLESTLQIFQFPATTTVTGNDLLYSANTLSGLEQRTTVGQLQTFVLSGIAQSTLTNLPNAIMGAETVPVGRSGLYQTTIQTISNFTLAPITNGSLPGAGTLTGTETVPVARSGGLFQTTINAIMAVLAGQLAPARQSVPVTSNGQSVYQTTGYNVGMVNVFVAGFRLNPNQYAALDGVNIIITDPVILSIIVVGMTVDIDAIVSFGSGSAATVASVQALYPTNMANANAFTGAELFSLSQGAVLLKSTLTNIAQWVVQTYQGFVQNSTTSTARTVQAKLRELSVAAEDFGAMGDGVTDDMGAFQRAANFLYLMGGGTIRLLAGKTYYLSQYLPAAVNGTIVGQTMTGTSKILWLPSNCTIDGNGATLLISGGSSSPLGFSTSVNLLASPPASELSVPVSSVNQQAQTAVLSTVSGLIAGQQVCLARVGGITGSIPNTPSQERSPMQMLTIQAINTSTNTLTFNEPFSQNFASAQNLALYSNVGNTAYPTNVWLKDITIQSVPNAVAYVLFSRLTRSGFKGYVNFLQTNWSLASSQEIAFDHVYNLCTGGAGTPTIESCSQVSGKYIKSEGWGNTSSLGGLLINDNSRAVNIEHIIMSGFSTTGMCVIYGVTARFGRIEILGCAQNADAITTFHAALVVGYPSLGTVASRAIAQAPWLLIQNCGSAEVTIDDLYIAGYAAAGVKAVDVGLSIKRAYIEFANTAANNSAPILVGQSGWARADPTYFPLGGQTKVVVEELHVKTQSGTPALCLVDYGYPGIMTDSACKTTAPVLATATTIQVDNPQNLKWINGIFFIGDNNTGVVPNNATVLSVTGNTLNLSAPIGQPLATVGSPIWGPQANPNISKNVRIEKAFLDGTETPTWNGEAPQWPVLVSGTPNTGNILATCPSSGCWILYVRFLGSGNTTVAEAAYLCTFDSAGGIANVSLYSYSSTGQAVDILPGATMSATGVVSIPVQDTASTNVRAIFKFVANGSLQMAQI
jgi:hypothetical protein